MRRRSIQLERSANLATLSVVPVPVLLGSDVPSDNSPALAGCPYDQRS
ncbi:hypothetical protein L0F81_22195 [Streptomyces tricolor]|uniref:Uncharacterized protein n=1 Tax=Streptomyces tricolor TaxID=68277 RepID=A0ABS9JK74_9ACTN|nr:hypothetical protein [Streptomyces tricolor]MCG0065973.1 hypothetical protein [Streptomyces tricolor]